MYRRLSKLAEAAVNYPLKVLERGAQFGQLRVLPRRRKCDLQGVHGRFDPAVFEAVSEFLLQLINKLLPPHAHVRARQDDSLLVARSPELINEVMRIAIDTLEAYSFVVNKRNCEGPQESPSSHGKCPP